MLIVGAAKAGLSIGKIDNIISSDRIITAIFISILLLLRILRVFLNSFHARYPGPNLVKNVENKFCRTT